MQRTLGQFDVKVERNSVASSITAMTYSVSINLTVKQNYDNEPASVLCVTDLVGAGLNQRTDPNTVYDNQGLAQNFRHMALYDGRVAEVEEGETVTLHDASSPQWQVP